MGTVVVSQLHHYCHINFTSPLGETEGPFSSMKNIFIFKNCLLVSKGCHNKVGDLKRQICNLS